MRFIVALITVASLASPALACVNDRETSQHEREFRSNYRDSSPQPGPSTAPDDYAAPGRSPILARTSDRVMLGSGVVLLAGAGLIAARKRSVVNP